MFKKSVRQPGGKGGSSAAPVKVMNTPTVKVQNEPYKPKPQPPTLRLTSKDLPSVDSWKVGGKYKLVLEVEEIGSRQGQDYYGLDSADGSDSSKIVSATFKVTSVKEA